MATAKQKKVFDRLGETGGNISKAMVGVYANPQKTEKVTQSVGWKELMETYLPDKLLAQKHLELLNKSGQDGEIDAQAVKSGLDMAYKLKGAYASDKAVEKIADKITSIEFKFPGSE